MQTTLELRRCIRLFDRSDFRSDWSLVLITLNMEIFRAVYNSQHLALSIRELVVCCGNTHTAIEVLQDLSPYRIPPSKCPEAFKTNLRTLGNRRRFCSTYRPAPILVSIGVGNARMLDFDALCARWGELRFVTEEGSSIEYGHPTPNAFVFYVKRSELA